MKKLCLIHQKKVAEHDFGPSHPLRADRLALHVQQLRNEKLVDRLGLSIIDDELELSDEDILAAHDQSLLDEIKQLSLEGGWLDGDTPVPLGTYERTKLQAGGLLYGFEAVLKGQYDRALQNLAFGGHHAMRRHGRITFGFCYFNQEAIVIRRLQREKKLDKALILDCDCHHGNGIQDIFYDDPSVLYISLHQDPQTLYPSVMGYVEETGEGRGKGYNVNVPLPPGTKRNSYLMALSEIFPPLAEEFSPETILFNINGDTHFMDPLTGLALDLNTYPKATQVANRVANEVCGGRMVSETAGGYDPKVAISCACAVTAALAEDEDYRAEDPYGDREDEAPHVTDQVKRVISAVKERHAPYWRCFRAM